MPRLAKFAPLALAIFLVACGDTRAPLEPANSLSAGLASPDGAVTPMCQLGCIDPDPTPTYPGVFLGSGVTPYQCFTPGVQTDGDQDGLSDFCEKNLANAFAPAMVYDNSDDIRGEPRWIAQRLGDSVQVGYLFSYYNDLGAESTLQCKAGFPLLDPFFDLTSCNGHNGDSEQIYVVVLYDAETAHWVLKRARYYQHEGFTEFRTRFGKDYPILLEYATDWGSAPGGKPRVWVSFQKHASYATQSDCNSGGTGFVDTCNNNQAQQVFFISVARNIGSQAVHDSVTQ